MLNEIRIDITLKFRFFPRNTDFDFKLTNAQLIMVVVLILVRIPWSKVEMSRVPVKILLLLLIPMAAVSNAVSFSFFSDLSYFNEYQPRKPFDIFHKDSLTFGFVLRLK